MEKLETPKEYEHLHDKDKEFVNGFLFALEDLHNDIDFAEELVEYQLTDKMYELFEDYMKDYKEKLLDCMQTRLNDVITSIIENGEYEKEIEEGKFE